MDTVGDLTPAGHECDVISGEHESGTSLDKGLGTESALDFTEKTWKEDFALNVENRKLYVAKNILAFVSPVFEKMFQLDFKEKHMTELDLPGKKYDDVQEFLRCIYQGMALMRTDMSHENALRLIPLADEYQVPGLKSKCEQVLVCSLNTSSIDEVYDMLAFADAYSMEHLLRKCINKVSEKPITNLDRGLKRKFVSLESQCEIKDKMVRRLEQSEREKKWFESAYRILLHGAEAEEKRTIKKCFGWTGMSLQFSPTVEELRSSRPKHRNTFLVLECEVEYKLEALYSDMYLEFKIDEKELQGLKLLVYGRLVIKCGTNKNEDFNGTFEMTLSTARSVQCVNIKGNTGKNVSLFSETEGFIHNGAMEIEIHLLADKNKT